MQDSNYIVSISGYGWSGSTAIRDLLREYGHFNHFKKEYGFISDPHGFIDLENSLVQDWNFLKNDFVIQNFIALTSSLAKPKSRVNHFGLDLGKNFDIDFEEILNDFIKEISEFKYNLASRVNYNYLSTVEKLLFKIKSKTGKKRDNHFFSAPSEEVFLNAVRKFHSRLFESKLQGKNLILEKVIPVNNIEKSIRYFDNIKVLVVDRDPRDSFVDMKANNGLFWGKGQEATKEKVEQFVKWRKTMDTKSNLKSIRSENVLFLRFEDCVFDYEESKNKIESFLGLDPMEHKLKKEIFNPEVSSKNIGKWKQYPNQEVIDWIASGLSDQLYKP